MPKLPSIGIYLPDEMLEEIKTLDPNVASVDDLIKCEENIWVR